LKDATNPDPPPAPPRNLDPPSASSGGDPKRLSD